MTLPSTRCFSLIASGTLAAASLVACGGGSDDDAGDAAARTGTLAAAIVADAPTCGLDAINVTITKLRFHTDAGAAPDAAGWTELTLAPARKLNLLNLASAMSGTTTDLGEATLPVGIYTQLRLVLDANASNTANTVRVTGAATDVPLETPAALGTGIRLGLSNPVEAGKKSGIVLAFDACESVRQTGSTFRLAPVPRIVPAAFNGIRGFIDPAALNATTRVRAQQGGGILATTVPDPATGEFVLPRLTPGAGNYDVVITGDDKATVVVGAVPLAAGAVTAVATAAAPIRQNASATSTISGKVSYTAPAVAPTNGTLLLASQIIAANGTIGNVATTVTHRAALADPATGAYTLAKLPRASVEFAMYRTALPLSFAPAVTTLTTGRYRVEARATGFAIKTTTASASVNVATVDVAGIDIPLP